jgi:hypothetical protein
MSRIDWAARAREIPQTPPAPTDETDKTRVSSVLSVEGGHVSANDEVAPADATAIRCTACTHRQRAGNFGEPAAAGLADRFELVWAPEGHAGGCPAFSGKPPAVAQERPYRLSRGEGDAAHQREWDDGACARFEARTAAIQRRGFNAQDAEDLGERMHLLDVQAEGRVLCLGCGHLRGSARIGWRCGNHTQAQVGRELPLALVTQPQRCLGFATSR